MRQTLLVLTTLGMLAGLLAMPGHAAAGSTVLGWHRGRSCDGLGPPVVYTHPYGYYATPVYPPYVYGPSHFRPEAPRWWNAERNWRDTWQDDGVKVHGYTFR
jgi:hypothetical protein